MDADYLGELLVRKFHNTATTAIRGLCAGEFDSPNHREFQALIRPLSDEQKELLRSVVAYCAKGALNDTLHALDEELNETNPRITIMVDGRSLAQPGAPASLHRGLWGPQGWMARFGAGE